MQILTKEFPTLREALLAFEDERVRLGDTAVLDALAFHSLALAVGTGTSEAADKELLARYFVALCERQRQARLAADIADPRVGIPEVAISAYLGPGVVARRVLEATTLAVARRQTRRSGRPWVLRVRRH